MVQIPKFVIRCDHEHGFRVWGSNTLYNLSIMGLNTVGQEFARDVAELATDITELATDITELATVLT